MKLNKEEIKLFPFKHATKGTQIFLAWWNTKTIREQKLLSIAIAFAGCVLVYQILFAPAWQGREKLQQSLLVLKQQATQMHALSQEAMTLSDRTLTPAAVSRDNLESSLIRKNMKPQQLSIAGEQVRLQWIAVSFANLFEWLEEARQTQGLMVLEAEIVALAQTGKVRASVTLSQLKNE